MSDNIRIPVDFSKGDKFIKVNLEQEFDNLEILSLKITNSDAYVRQCSDFGVVIGRVMLNNGFGVQNAKVNIFIPINDEDKERVEIFELYPFETINDTYPNGVRYNLLPRIRNDRNPSHRAVGNFPTQNDLTHYPQYLEILDKYYKYTTTTNESGDFMIFGVPVGQHDIIMDFDVFDTDSFDLSANDLVEQISLNGDINQLREFINSNVEDVSENRVNRGKVPNFIHLGGNNFEVEVKTDIDNMPNIFHQTKQITVSPFWGDLDNCDIGITRCDFKINFKYTPTAIFFGFLHAPSGGYNIKPDYSYNLVNGERRLPEINANGVGDIWPLQEIEIVVYRLDDDLTIGSRKRLGVFKGSLYNGVFRLSLPMYMDYYTTNELGDLVPTNNTEIGIPTKGYYAFEIYDTDDAWSGRRLPWGGFENPILPGIRIPSTNNGDVWLGGWEGTWTSLFEYDLINRKRKFYTVKTIHGKHSLNNAILPGDFIGYFPQFNQDKSEAYWNFPLHYNDVSDIQEPTIIGSVLIPRISTELKSQFLTPNKILTEPWKDKSETFNEWVNDWEMYLGIGVKKEGGKNLGSVYSELFSSRDFIRKDSDNKDISIFGDKSTWNFGDNSEIVFNANLYATELAKKSGSNANSDLVHKAFNQVANEFSTYGVFINSVRYTNKIPILETYIYDITDELPNLIKDGVYSSYRKGIGSRLDSISDFSSLLNTIKVDSGDEITIVEDDVSNFLNAYNGNFYYFGLWEGANALYDIEKNYFIK